MKKEFLSKKGTYKVTFALPKEAVNGAKEVVVLGDFNNWDRKGVLLSSKNGHYQTTMELNAGRYEFRYLIDQDRWGNDWAADAYVASPFTGIENSVITLDTVAKKAPAKKVTKAKAAAKKAPAKKVVTKKAAPVKKAVAKKDDLTKIEGIGPTLAKVLAEAGVETFKT